MLHRGWYLITVEIELQIKHGQLLIFALRSGWIMKRWREFEFLPAPFLRRIECFSINRLYSTRGGGGIRSSAVPWNWILRIV